MNIKLVPKFEVETRIGADDWENVWHVDDQLQTFPSEKAAQEAIDEFFEDLRHAGMADDYRRNDYRIVEK